MFRVLGRRERSISCDGHIFFYTTHTLRQLLEAHGLRVVKANRVGRTVSLGRLLWNMEVMLKSSALQQVIGRLNDSLALDRRWRIYLNTREIIRMYAMKVIC